MRNTLLRLLFTLGINCAAQGADPPLSANQETNRPISKTQIEREVSRWHPSVQNLFARDYTTIYTGISFAYENRSGKWPERSAAYAKDADVILLGTDIDPEEAAQSIHHEIGHALLEYGILKDTNAQKLIMTINALFEEPSYSDEIGIQSRMFLLNQRIKLARSELMHLKELDSLLQESLHESSQLIKHENNALKLTAQVLEIASHSLDKNIREYDINGQTNDLPEDIATQVQSVEEGLAWIARSQHETAAAAIHELRKRQDNRLTGMNGPHCDHIREEIIALHDNLEAIKTRRARAEKNIEHGIDRLKSFDERFARTIDSLMSNYHFEGDMNNVRLNEATLSLLEKISFKGKLIFRVPTALYRAGEKMIENGESPEYIQEIFFKADAKLVSYGLGNLRLPTRIRFNIIGEIPDADEIEFIHQSKP